ncbi:MAG TPA: serine/threonine-protein kinase, partial [Gemmatimonadales bacterium]|nr:serine/threonine-protein kinase [Gemmatimonadales bacterium]
MKICTACGQEYGDEVLFCQKDGTPLRPSGGQTADLVGQVIADRYHIQKKLGEGGMGQVYLAEHVKMGRRCAIKIMSPAMMKDPDAISRFNREAANASRIGHPNVCAIYDFGETPEGLIYLAMEFIEGRSLNAILEEAGTLPLARAASIIGQCADALQVAHDLEIVHRDLKPDNIMVVTTRGRDTVKVVDFGIAKAVGAEGGSQKVTKTGFVVGTPEYMSPEQLAGDPVDGRSDLYSLALVFYRMLTGGTPFPADSQQETMIKRLTDDPLPLASARPDIRFPPELQRVMDRALARMPQDRYASAAEFARDVRSVSSSATGQVDVEAGTQQMQLRPRGAAPSATGAGAVPATRIDPAVERQRAAAAAAAKQAPATIESRGGKKFPVVPVAIGVVLLAVAGGGYAMRDKLMGGGRPAADSARVDSSKVAQGGGGQPGSSPDSQQLPAKDTPQPVTDTQRLTHPGPGPTGTPGGSPGKGTTTPPRDSASKPTGTIDNPPRIDLPSPDDFDDPATRGPARAKAIAVYNTAAADPQLRA